MPVLDQRRLSLPRQTINEVDALLHMALGEATSAARRWRPLQSPTPPQWSKQRVAPPCFLARPAPAPTSNIVSWCLRSRRQLLESSVPRVDEPAATGSSYSDVVLVQEIIALCEHAV